MSIAYATNSPTPSTRSSTRLYSSIYSNPHFAIDIGSIQLSPLNIPLMTTLPSMISAMNYALTLDGLLKIYSGSIFCYIWIGP